MKLIIDISDKTYEIIKNMVYFYNPQRSGRGETKEIFNAIKQGIPLPKGHGDLIDRNECLKLKMTDLYDKDGVTMYAVPTGNILRMKPVIEADKGE